MKYVSLELLRGIAAFGIVACHIMLYPLTDGGRAAKALCDMNVGLFAALSGFLMWKEAPFGSVWAYAKRRAARLLPVYLVWSVAFVLFSLSFDLLVRHALKGQWLDWKFWPSVLLRGNASCHLWFLISLFYSQILFCMVAKLLPVSDKWWVVISGVGVCVIGSWHGTWYSFYLGRLFVFMLAGFGLRAYVGRDVAQSARKCKAWALALIAAIVVHYVLEGMVQRFIRDWLVVVPMLLTFVFMPITNERISRVCSILGTTSMGVFLVHPIVTCAMRLLFEKLFKSPFGVFPVMLDWILCWALAFGVALLGVRCPFLKRWWS